MKYKEDKTIVAFPERKSVRTQASEWIAFFEINEPNAEQLKAFKVWIKEDPQHPLEFERLSLRWADLNALTQLTQPAERPYYSKEKRKRLMISGWGGAVLASLALFMMVVLFPWQQQSQFYKTAIGERKTIILSDKSIVNLNTNSHIKVDYSEARRGIYLIQGEAHFDVKKNPVRPFEVHAGLRLVRAVGTAFNVRLHTSDVEVIISEGVVEVDSIDNRTQLSPLDSDLPVSNTPHKDSADKSPRVAVSLEKQIKPQRFIAGEQVTYKRSELDIIQRQQAVNVSRKLSWRNGTLEFKREPLQYVVAEISRYTEKNIVVVGERARQLRVGGRFDAGDTDTLLEVLESGFGITVSYEQDNTIYLSFDAEFNESNNDNYEQDAQSSSIL